jgi:hypothetical protein
VDIAVLAAPMHQGNGDIRLLLLHLPQQLGDCFGVNFFVDCV